MSTERDGRYLPNAFIERFRKPTSTDQVFTTFTWHWKTPVRDDGRLESFYSHGWPEPIAVDHQAPFTAITHRHVQRNFDWDSESGDEGMGLIGGLRGDVYQFRRDGDVDYLTVIVARDQNVVQFRRGIFDVGDPTELSSLTVKVRANDISRQ